MPFGLCNAGATFQRIMHIVMSGLHFHVCLIYLDDIIVFAGSLEQHLDRLVMVFECLRTAGLKLKPGKCLLLQKSVLFLGHVVSGHGIATDPSKVKLVAEWPTPRSLRDVRAFLGLAGYYRRFVAGFASIAGPLHAMMGKGKKFLWTPEAQQSFDHLNTEGTGLRLGMHCACVSVENIGIASVFGIGPTRAPSFCQRPPHASSCRHWPCKGPMNLVDWEDSV